MLLLDNFLLQAVPFEVLMFFCVQFFVASDPAVKTDRLWHDKYTLRTSMIPSFMTMDQSRKVGCETLVLQCDCWVGLCMFLNRVCVN